jgi:putative ABC transport system permease protein
MAILRLALQSLLNRRFTALLTLVSIALSVALLLGVERVRTEARASFASTLSGTDLIVGARSGPVQLMLYAVFRIGNATNNISWQSYQEIAAMPRVAWTVPLSLGDSHRGFPVLGTSQAYFDHYRYGREQPLVLAQGERFTDLYDAVLGAEVAAKLGYGLGDEIIIAHGASDVSFTRHDDKPFRVVGILERTGTPVDRTLHVSLEAIEAIHLGWEGGAPMRGREIDAERAREMDLTPKAITAVLVGLDSRIATFALQRRINDYPQEPLLAVLPGVALSELWSVIGLAENALLVVSAFVVLVGLIGMLTALLIGLDGRRRELAILRSLGARPAQVLGLIIGEAALLTLLGILLGLGLLSTLLAFGQPLIEARLGLHLGLGMPKPREWQLLAAVLATGLLVGLLPGWRAYKMSLSSGLSLRL